MKILLKTRYAPDFECDQDGNTDCFYHQVNKVVAKINKTKQKQKNRQTQISSITRSQKQRFRMRWFPLFKNVQKILIVLYFRVLSIAFGQAWQIMMVNSSRFLYNNLNLSLSSDDHCGGDCNNVVITIWSPWFRSGAGQQCCYDLANNLMMTSDNKWGGSPMR